ncbi:hypothetical protein TWF694_001816 [Orbilia ellipsospora]|uniref:Uncharacterized protein n=1 Tax=Orbilia ellipsospora TaxID=2528407 RepID=A0AAV9X4T7_9PEZI
MITIKVSPAVAAAILASISQVSAHCRFVEAWGDHNPGIKGGALAYLYEFPVKAGYDQYPYQWDTAVFSNPPVPPCCTSPYVSFKRKWLPQGCGADLHNVFDYYAKVDKNGITPPAYANLEPSNPLLWNIRNYNYFQRPLVEGAMIQTEVEIKRNAASGKISRCSPGGWINIVIWQVNDDGAGPFRCRIDTTGTGQHFGGWVPTILTQPPGTQAGYSVNPGTNSNYHNLKVKLPPGARCKGSFGKFDNVCLMRCENYAVNGPFGGCLPFQIIEPAGAEPKPKEKPHPHKEVTDPGYDVGSGNYKENYGGNMANTKRDIRGARAQLAARIADAKADVESAPAVEAQAE